MSQNLKRYKKDLEKLINDGSLLHTAMQWECFPEATEKALGDKASEVLSKLPAFSDGYQTWYSEAKSLVRQLLPDRLDDLVRYYEKPKPRKELTYESYRIEDYLQGLNVTRGWEKELVVSPDAAIPHFRQQIAIVKAVLRRFESSLFDIRQLVQADIFDSELEAAGELLKRGFVRASGAVAGVVLEKHLRQVCENHKIKFRKKAPTISDYNDALKKQNVIDTPEWRFIQHLGDVRNLCDHSKDSDPTKDQVDDLVSGVSKVTKTLF